MSYVNDAYYQFIQRVPAFEIGYEFDYLNNEKYYIEAIDESDVMYPYEIYPVSVRDELHKLLSSNKYEDELEYEDFVDRYRLCVSERKLFELKIKSLEKEIEQLKGEK